MEPMTLGSPVSPPPMSRNFAGGNSMFPSSDAGMSCGLLSSTGTPTTSAPAPFLPSYLLGYENSRVATPGSSPGSRPGLFPGQSPTSPHSAKENFAPNFTTPRFGRGGAVGDRPSGPPVMGLSPHTPVLPSHLSSRPQQHHSPFHPDLHRAQRTPLGSPVTPMRGAAHTPIAGRAADLNSSIISTEVHGDVSQHSGVFSEWVTVFGFPVASASYILTQFAQLGSITDQRLQGAGNWMHLKYQTHLQARKAMAFNGKVFGENIMIGVMQCTDRAVVAGAGNKENTAPGTNTFASPGMVFNTSAVDASSYSTPKANIRSLTQALPTTPADNQVLPASNTPKKNDSFMSKAMHHLLGV